MNYGYNLAASGVITAMFRQDVAANNLANIETVGFKPDTAFTIPRDAARIEDRLHNLPSNALLEKLGAGVFLAPTRTSHTQGALNRTGNPLDIAIKGDGFFVVSSASAGGAGDQLRLTRDGRLTLNPRGELVTVTGGNNLLDESGRIIRLEPGSPVEIGGDGTISQDGTAVARLKLADIADKSQLRKIGHNLYSASATAIRSADASDTTGEIVQGHIEASAVDPIQAMMAVQNAANAVSSATRLMSVHDEITGRLISTLGRVSA